MVYIMSRWRLIFTMNAEKRLSWANNQIIRAMSEGLRGSITFHFNEGFLVSSQTTSNEKPCLDDMTEKS